MKAPGDRPTGVRPVSGVLDEREQLAVAEDRHDRARVLGSRAADEGVVHDEDVALVVGLLADPRDHALHGVRQGPHVRREVFLPFRHHSSVGVADGGAEVAALAHDERVAHPLEHQAHLVDDAHEGVAEDLERHRVDPFRPGGDAPAHRASSRVMTMFPTASTWAGRAGRQHHGAVELLDHARPGQLVSGHERFPVENACGDPAVFVEVHLLLALGSRRSALLLVPHGAQVALLAQASRRHPQRRGLERALGMGIAVLTQMLLVGCGDRSGEPLLRQVRDRHRHRVELPDVAEVDGALDDDRAGLDALTGQPGHDPLLHLVEELPHLRQVDLVLPAYPRPREVVERVDKDEADRARHSGERGNDHLGHPELDGEIDRV